MWESEEKGEGKMTEDFQEERKVEEEFLGNERFSAKESLGKEEQRTRKKWKRKQQ